MQYRVKRIGKIVFITFLVFVAGYFLLRNAIARYVVDLAKEKIRDRYGYHLSLSNIQLTGLAGVSISGLSVTPQNGDTLLKIASVYIRPSIPHILFGKVKLVELNLSDLFLKISCQKGVCNYNAKIQKKDSALTKNLSESDYGKLLYRLSKKAFFLCPRQSQLTNLNFIVDVDSVHEHISIPGYTSVDGTFEGTIVDNNKQSSWKLKGNFSQRKETFDMILYPEHLAGSSIPLAEKFFKGYFSFDTLQFQLSENELHSGELVSKGLFHADHLKVKHSKLSDDTIRIDNFSYDFATRVGSNYFELDSSTKVLLNQLELNLYARYEKAKAPVYSLMMKTGSQPANNFFKSLPEGMFSELQNIEADGNLDFHVRFKLDGVDPDAMLFDVRLKKEKFKLKKYGSNSLLKMNSEFSHTVYEYGSPVKTFVVGPSNPDFVPLDQVSPYLRSAILTSEDGNFFYHNGFNEEAFRNSIIINYKAGKFKRGGSTISMQLVKNVYLTRKKTVARKVEEAFIVWLIESNRLVSKERMFEVYLNIIELGPYVYGVKDASRFYFEKSPAELSLSESIFLASLLPKPKWFKYSFDSTGTLKPHMAGYYRIVSDFLLRKNLITEQEHEQAVPNVKLTGRAKEMVVPVDTIPVDTLETDFD